MGGGESRIESIETTIATRLWDYNYENQWSINNIIINIIKNHSDKPQKVAEVIQFVRESGGIQYATQAMQKHVEEAKAILHSFPESTYRTSLEGLVQFTIDRSK